MKQNLFKFLIVFTMVIAINYPLRVWVYQRILPYYWGNKGVEAKRKYLLANHINYNTLFIGSSKTHNQIIPDLFDKRASDIHLNIHSYNFGVSGLIPLESLYVYENLLNKDSLFFKTVFIELDWLATIKYENLNSIRNYYYLNDGNYFCALHSISNSSVSIPSFLWGIFHYTLDYFENNINLGKAQEAINYLSNQITTPVKIDSSGILRGFEPLQAKLPPTERDLYKEVIGAAEKCSNDLEDLKKGKPSAAFLDKLQEIVNISQNKGITLYFIVPLQWKYYQYKELIPIIENIRHANVIPMFDVERDSALYRLDNFADPNHLNANGAKYFTNDVFELFHKFQ